MRTPIALHTLQGQVLRFRGVVDRFGGYEQQDRIQHTICIRNLELAQVHQPLDRDHWWFKLRAEWCSQPLQPGDTVVFTAKVAHASKGDRGRVIGFGGQVRDLVITGHEENEHTLVNSLQEQMQRQALLRQEAEATAQRLERHRDALLRDLDQLRGQLATWKARCQILDPSLSQVDRPRSLRGCRQRQGFQHVDRLILPRQRRQVASFA